MLAAMDTALMDRQTRLTIDFSGINGIMWVVLIVGAFITVAFTYLFGFDQTIMQQLMIGGLSLLIGLVLFLDHGAGLSVPRQHRRRTGGVSRAARNIQRDRRVAKL